MLQPFGDQFPYEGMLVALRNTSKGKYQSLTLASSLRRSNIIIIAAQLFIGRSREPSPVPFGLSANHANRRLDPLTEPSGSIGFQVIEP